MSDALSVAQFIIHLAAQEKDSDPITPLRLQKLLYYAQGWHLAVFGTPLFPEEIQAWKHGPVVPRIYPRFANCGPTIPEEEGQSSGLPPLAAALVRSVWDHYKHLSPSGLRNQTHEEAPWKDARKGISDEERSEEVITPESLLAFFKDHMGSELLKGLSPSRAYEAAAEIDQGKGSSHKDVFARVRQWNTN